MTLTNTGEKLCKPRIAIAINGPGFDKTVERKLDTVLPGDTIEYPFPLEGAMPAGTFETSTTVKRCGEEIQQSDRLELAQALSGVVGTTPPAAAVQPAGGGVSLPVIIGIALGGALGGGGLAFLALRRRSGERVP